MNETTAQTSSRQIQRRLRHRIRTGRPAQGASIISTTTGRDDSAAGAARDRIAGLHLEHQARWSLRHRDQVEAWEVEENIASVAAIERVSAWATVVGHRRGP